MGHWPLIGRDEELDLLDQVVVGRSGSVAVSGGAGIGKSRLVTDFLERLRQQGVRTVMVRATRSTATIPFGPFAPWAPHQGDHGGMAPNDRLQVMQAISRALLADADTVVAVDDAHLLDEGSAALLLHLAVHTPARVVATVRSDERSPDGVVALWKEGLAELLELQPLSEPETAALVEHVLNGPVEPATGRRLWALTEGIPLYLREVLHTGTEQGVLARSSGVWRWRGGFRRTGWRLRELMGDRLDHVGPDEHRVLELVAFGEPLPPELLVELGCGPAMAEAEAHGFLVVDAAAGQPTVRFAHPLYGEVLRADVPRLVARARRRALTEAALARGWQEHDPLRVASWWLASGADEADGDPEMLLAAAHRALAVGDWELVDRLGRAAAAAGAGPRAGLARAAALVCSWRVDEADELTASLLDGPLDDDLFAEVTRVRADLLFWRRGAHDAAREVLDRARTARPLPAAARGLLLCHGGYLAAFACDPLDADRLTTQAMEEAGSDVGLRVQALSTAAFALACRGRTAAALDAAEKALPDAAAGVEDIPNATSVLPVAYGLALVLDGRIDEAAAVAEHALALSQQVDVRISQAIAAAVAGRIAVFQGRPATAQQAVRDALPLLGEAQMVPHWPAAVLALGAAQVGDPATAGSALDLTVHSPPVPLKGLELGLAEAWTAAARDDLPAALRTVTRVANDAGACGVWGLEVLALVELTRLGAPATAAPRLAELADVVEGPYVRAAAALARAAAGGDGPGLDAVSDQFEAMGATLLAAEAAARAGIAHRAARQPARHAASLARARRLAARCEGACTPALRQLDADPLVHALTRREREVVQLAARGLTNREIASELYISLRTVNAHLNHAYAKLGTSDRHQAADLLPTVSHVAATTS